MQNSPAPIDALVAEIVERLDANQREDFEERAGIMQYDGQFPRAHAECLALLDVLRRNPAVLSGLFVLEVELDGSTQWLLTTNLAYARRHLQDIGGIELEVLDPADVVDGQYGGMALLTTLG